MPGSCTFGYDLALTPVLLSTSPSSGNEGDTLTVTGHTLSLTAAENVITVGGQRCDMLSAATSSSFTPPTCPVLSCTQEMQTMVELTCRMPHLDSLSSHEITLGTVAGGQSPKLAAAVVTTSPQMRSFSPASGSVAGGTSLMIIGDGFSSRVGDLEVSIGSARCRVTSVNSSHVSCTTPVAAVLTSSSNAAIALSVQGVAATCTASPCTFAYSRMVTPILSAATVASVSSQWTVTVTGTFGSGSDVMPNPTILIGGLTPCLIEGEVTASSLTCIADPPLSGTQTITLESLEWGTGLGEPSLPTIEGVGLTATGVSPTTTTLAGGATLTIAGSGFSATDTSVLVCGDACEVLSVSSTSVECRAPSSLLHASGVHTLTLSNVTDAALELGFASPPPPPPGIAAIDVADKTISLRQSRVVAFAFPGITAASLPRGATLRSVMMLVKPQAGASGAVVVDVRASLQCNGGPEATSSEALASSTYLLGYNATNTTVEWDVQPYDFGFASDQTPDLAPLLVDEIGSRDTTQSCALILTLQPKAGAGIRHFYGPDADLPEQRPRLVVTYEPPTTADQLQWAMDRTCDVSVAIPVPLSADDVCSPIDAAKSLPVEDPSTCPHLQLRATAATTADSCAMTVNGLSLFGGCGLDKLVVGRDGVCVARLDEPNVPRAACFDTRTAGVGADQLASWIDALPQGASAMVVSCSRAAWAYNRVELRTSLASLGALLTPEYVDDAYALVGTKGASAPIAEARTQCCQNPDPVCVTCDQTVAVAAMEVACGSITEATSSILVSPVFGSFGSDSYMEALSDSAIGSGLAQTAATSEAATSPLGAISALQANDVDVFDAECNTLLAIADGERYGTRLATDGDSSTYWLAVGAPDAVLTLNFGVERQVTELTIDWEAAPSSLLVLYTTSQAIGTWFVGASIQGASSAPSTITLNDGGPNGAVGVNARRIRLYMADPVRWTNLSLPMFGVRELVATSCALPMKTIDLSSQVAYNGALTPTVTSVSPERGSTAGGTTVTLTVTGLPDGTGVADVTVSIVGQPCSITSVTSTQLVCVTSSYGVTSVSKPGNGPVSLTLPAVGTAAATEGAVYEYVDLWSSCTTWGGAPCTIPGLDTTGESVWIQPGQRIMLDCDVDIYMLVVQGTLEFDRKDINLDARYVFVMDGRFTVGTEQAPFLQKAVITLHGGPVSTEIPVYGAKTLSCRFCSLDLHGKPVLDGRTHVKLAQTAPAGASELLLQEPIGWDPGSEIVVTSTAANGTLEEFDMLIIDSVTNNGLRIVLKTALKYEHLGETMRFDGGHSADFRANVALLSRNVVVQGDPSSMLDKHGGHIMLHSRSHASILDRSQGESLTARIEDIEVRYSGQMGRLGRYSIHFHMIGAVRNSYVRRCSIHHTYNRAVAIHGVHYLRVQDNVAFETKASTVPFSLLLACSLSLPFVASH